ncbi:MAG: hypothetical protein AAEJ65_07835 [Planctomycetota bacterium]
MNTMRFVTILLIAPLMAGCASMAKYDQGYTQPFAATDAITFPHDLYHRKDIDHSKEPQQSVAETTSKSVPSAVTKASQP